MCNTCRPILWVMNTIEQVNRPLEGSELNDDNTNLTNSPINRTPEPRSDPPEQIAPPSPNNLWKFLFSILLISATVAIVYWQRERLQRVNPYIPVAIPSCIALGQIIFKDWNNYKPKWVRWVLSCLVLAACTWGLLYQSQQLREKVASSARADAAQQAQEQNTKSFLSALQSLSSQLNDLKTKVATKDLQDQLARVKGELEKTRLALAGPPPIKLLTSLTQIDLQHPLAPNSAVIDKQLPIDANGVVHVPFFVYNPEERAAVGGLITLIICDDCKFAKEPTGFIKVKNDYETRRELQFPQIPGTTQVSDLSADIIPPPGATEMPVGLIIKCNTCVAPQGITTLLVHLQKDRH